VPQEKNDQMRCWHY